MSKQTGPQAFSLQQQETVPNCSGNEISPGLSCDVSVGEKRKRNEYAEICNTENHIGEHNNRREFNDNGDAEMGEELVQPNIAQCVGLKFSDFDKLREDRNFAVGQTWALYDTAADGMPRLYALIRKVSAPSFGLRITYLEPDPDNEKEVQWCEQDLPVSAGKFRLGKNENTKDLSVFSHLMQCSVVSNTRHFTISPRKGETWALFKNWDIKWSSEPDSHRKYEYEFVEILSDFTDGAGVFVAHLHKAKGFASVFFRMGTGNADIFRILPHSLYRFSHMVPSFKLTGTEGKGLPKDAYELDQAALPETIEEITVPSVLESTRKSKPQAIYFLSKGKVFKTGQIWSFYRGNDELPLYYGKIQKITFTQAFKQEPVLKLHISLLKALPSPPEVIQWIDKQMPITSGTFYPRKAVEVITQDDVSHQMLPQTSMDGNEYTIFPKVGDVWAIYRFWTHHIDVEDLEEHWHYDVVEVLDNAYDYKVLLLEPDSDFSEDEETFFRAVTEYKHNAVDGTEPIFTIK
ncbi:unnamed protein product [Microthlaspi erraticum]|uniref:DUF3444 domain-containing protein n=1 Tax=Microthlaspi erraticum TaxID=1685480 RepID=A0A6D2LCB3_9BRAS|nr:unnamed protein product [Microthlaspi erraticum]